ncbi:MAG: formylglycine-generating enzyme family protein [Planctomycetota bacterium]|nr:MAG: formylglycine-generating enzyme family protein [Planctomycetota bacterium]
MRSLCMPRNLLIVIFPLLIALLLAACGGGSRGSYELTETYLIIDISGGPDAASYPVSDSASAPADLNSDLYKTDRIVLRRIPAGTFMMGSPADELGRTPWEDNEDLHEVTLTQDFYMAVFQVTQAQWLNVMGGSNPSSNTGDTRPVERVSWDDARGGTWDGPDGGDPGSDTFIGRLAAKTGIAFDLPTDAQWEYAARAGTTTALNSGQNLTSTTGTCTNLNELGRYDGNRGYGEHAVVGSYTPNSWGLYDMHGNVGEWCLDWYEASLGTSAVTDPVGPASGSARVVRGGGWIDLAQICRTAFRIRGSPGGAGGILGFRPVSPGQPASSPEGDG